MTKTEARDVLVGLGVPPDPAWDYVEEARTDGWTRPLPGYRVTCDAADSRDGYAVTGPGGPLDRHGAVAGRRR